ncbi:odorant receptor Or2-like [Danaus plexippus]|uniref:odorant receptor Or2-like n=1 Tax=Danaus plexippus TaxID=13037 RepID=UPI002AB1B0A7|nr:odorant receptor Or2-like [Danaus plexippus]
MCLSDRKSVRAIYSIVLWLSIMFVITEYIELYCIRSNLTAALKNLSNTTLTHVTVIKVITFIIWQKDWMSVMNHVSTLELCQLNEKNEDTINIIRKYTKYSRNLSYCYWALVLISVLIFGFGPLAHYFFLVYMNEWDTPFPEIVSSWVPFDKTSDPGRWVLTVTQIMMAFYNGATLGIYDSNVFVLMTFFSAQFEILRLNCERIFDSGHEGITYSETVQRIQKCHYHHVYLVKNFKVLNSVISPVMFFYVIICSIMMCSSLVQLTGEGATTIDKIWISEYLIAQVFQLFLYCWHSHNVLVTSVKVDNAVYSSGWWSQDLSMRRNVLLLGGQLNKSIVFTAGPFANLSIVTFVAIIKAAYSYYTLLNSLD